MIVRPERPDDREHSMRVEREAFGSDAEPAIVAAVRDEDGSFAFVAEDGIEIVGHVQMARAYVGDREVVSLGPIGVVPRRQGQGIGRALVEASIEEARARGECAVILLGDPGLYPRFGFVPAAELGLHNPFARAREGRFEIAEEDFMIAPLDERAKDLRGEVRWHAAFG